MGLGQRRAHQSMCTNDPLIWHDLGDDLSTLETFLAHNSFLHGPLCLHHCTLCYRISCYSLLDIYLMLSCIYATLYFPNTYLLICSKVLVRQELHSAIRQIGWTKKVSTGQRNTHDSLIPQRSHFCSVSVKRQIRPIGKQTIAVIIPQMPYLVLGWWMPWAHWAKSWARYASPTCAALCWLGYDWGWGCGA